MKHLLLVVASLMLVSCVGGFQSMAWEVNCSTTTLKELDRRYTDGLYDLHIAQICKGPYGDDFTACPQYHTLWRRYWAARRELDQCGPAGTVRS